MILRNEDLILVTGGGISAALINALARGFNSIIDLGRSVGSAIRRIKMGKICII